jgi:hypothetical protein
MSKKKTRIASPRPEEIEEAEETVETGSRSTFSTVIQKSWMVFISLAYLLGIGSGYLIWSQKSAAQSSALASESTGLLPTPTPAADFSSIMSQVNPPEGYTIPMSVGDMGPQMIAAGVIDLPKFLQIFEGGNNPLSEYELSILSKGSDEPIVINAANAHFWLDFFWAVGLANQNAILTEGEMASQGIEKVVNFASTGGWQIAKRPVAEIYSSMPMIELSEEQQALLDEITKLIYRPCCNNSTHFPDCNHGMAMLGLMELMASQGSTKEEMLEAAKYVNAFWFPQQMLQVATAYKAGKDIEFKDLDPALAVGPEAFSSSGFQSMSTWLAQQGLLPSNQGGGSSCGL